MATVSDEPPAPPQLPRAAVEAPKSQRAWPASHVELCAARRGDRRAYFASRAGELWRYDALKDEAGACWTSGRAIIALAHRGNTCLALERKGTQVWLATYKVEDGRVAGRHRRVGTGNEGAVACHETNVLVAVGRDVALYASAEQPRWRVRNLGDVVAVALNSIGACVVCAEGAWFVDRASVKSARVLDAQAGAAAVLVSDGEVALVRAATLTLFSGDGRRKLAVLDLGAPVASGPALAYGSDGALLVRTRRALEVWRDQKCAARETAPPAHDQGHVLLRRLVRRVTVGVSDDFGVLAAASLEETHRWPDATGMDDFDEVGSDFSDEDHLEDDVGESVLDGARWLKVRLETGTPSTEPRLRYRSVLQDDFRPGRGNALQACVASLFGLELEDVPNFITLPEGYEQAIRAFCAVRRVTCEKMAVEDIPETFDGRMCILRGASPRGDFGHVVVARYVGSCDTSLHKMVLTGNGAFRLVHDPHPEGTFLDEGEGCGWALFFGELN